MPQGNSSALGFVAGILATLLFQVLFFSSGTSSQAKKVREVSSRTRSTAKTTPGTVAAPQKARKKINVAKKADDLYQLLPKADPLGRYPESTEVWFRHFEKEYDGLSSNLKRMLRDLADADQSVYSKLLCKKGYVQYCEQFVEQLKFKMSQSGQDRNSRSFNEDLQSTSRFYLMLACQSYSGESCKQLASWSRSLPRDFRKELSTYVYSKCNSGWIDGCLAYALYLRTIGKEAKATRVAVGVCRKHNHCIEAARILASSNPKKAATYYLLDCRRNSIGAQQGCTELLKKYPQTAQAKEAIGYLAKSCDKFSGRGPASCTILANYYMKANKPDLGKKYLQKGCVGGNQTACQFVTPQ